MKRINYVEEVQRDVFARMIAERSLESGALQHSSSPAGSRLRICLFQQKET